MTKGSKGSGNSASKPAAMIGYAECVPVARCGYAECVPANSTVSYESTKVSGGGKGSYESTTRFSYGDKQSGSYGRETKTEKASAGDFHWKNGTSGTRSEYKQSSTFRFGDRKGYTEVHSEQRIRNVTYDRSNGSGKNYLTYSNDDGGSYGGYGYDSGY